MEWGVCEDKYPDGTGDAGAVSNCIKAYEFVIKL